MLIYCGIYNEILLNRRINWNFNKSVKRKLMQFFMLKDMLKDHVNFKVRKSFNEK